MDEQKKKLDYDAHEDFRFPVEFLYKALWIIENHGYGSFRNYAQKVNMPHQDIERVLNKNKYKTDPEFRQKINSILKTVETKLNGTDLEVDLPF